VKSFTTTSKIALASMKGIFGGHAKFKGGNILIILTSANIISDFTWSSCLIIVQTTMFYL